jgi:hypothetical protein
MMAEDGESWQVARSRSGADPSPWARGQIIEIPLRDDPVRHITAPAWEEAQCEVPQRLPDAPANVVAEIWEKPVDAEAIPAEPPREIKPSIVFTADQFTPTQWNTAQQKADFANAFVRFLENGFRLEDFPRPFYSRLSQTFGHVAHFDQATFHRTFFTTAVDKVRFLRQCIEHQPVGDPAFTFSDVERLLRDWIVESRAMDRVTKTAEHAQNRAEREQLQKLLKKHGLPED